MPDTPTSSSIVSSALSGDNTTIHVATASALGGACSTVVCWALELAHIMPTPNVEAAFGVIFAVSASYLMQKLGN